MSSSVSNKENRRKVPNDAEQLTAITAKMYHNGHHWKRVDGKKTYSTDGTTYSTDASSFAATEQKSSGFTNQVQSSERHERGRNIRNTNKLAQPKKQRSPLRPLNAQVKIAADAGAGAATRDTSSKHRKQKLNKTKSDNLPRPVSPQNSNRYNNYGERQKQWRERSDHNHVHAKKMTEIFRRTLTDEMNDFGENAEPGPVWKNSGYNAERDAINRAKSPIAAQTAAIRRVYANDLKDVHTNSPCWGANAPYSTLRTQKYCEEMHEMHGHKGLPANKMPWRTSPGPSDLVNKCETQRSVGTLVSKFNRMPRPRKPFCRDPVALYHYYQEEWKYFDKQIPGTDNHHNDRKCLRWEVRSRLLDPN